ncbi:MAG: hypothetical protein JNL01_12955 [Bdellovibrionales bacterium]|nr:hypothetical protein [Bdellovibrionales bacterium]
MKTKAKTTMKILTGIAASFLFVANAWAADVIVRLEKIDGFGQRTSPCVDTIHPISGWKMKAKARETNIHFKSGKELFLQEVNYGADCAAVEHMEEKSELHGWLEELLSDPIELIVTVDDQEPTLIRSYKKQCLYGADDCQGFKF